MSKLRLNNYISNCVVINYKLRSLFYNKDKLMSEHQAKPTSTPRKVHKVEQGLESFIFKGRWLLAPFFVGLLFAVILLLIKFYHYFLMLI